MNSLQQSKFKIEFYKTFITIHSIKNQFKVRKSYQISLSVNKSLEKKMQPDIFYFKVIPKKVTIQKSVLYTVHPLNKYRLVLLKNSQQYHSTKGWVYAGNHKGSISLEQCSALQMTIDASMRTNFFTLQLMEIKYTLFKEGEYSITGNKPQKEQLIGKHNLFIKKYLSKFRFQNIHFFDQHSSISTDFILHYEVFVQRTLQGLNRIIEQHQRHNKQNRPRKGSEIQSIKSSTFSDKINQIQVKGENRFVINAAERIQGPMIGSQSKLDTNFISLNLKMNHNNSKIRRSGGNINTKQQLFYQNSKFYKEPNTERKNRQFQYQQEDKSKLYQEELTSPPLQDIHLKKLSSQQINITFDLQSSSKKLAADNNNTKVKQKAQSIESKKRRLVQEFQKKRVQFKRRHLKFKQQGESQPEILTERKLKRSNSTRSMRSIRLTELQNLPEEKPWVRKEKEKEKVRTKKFMYILIFFLVALLYLAMQPNRNLEIQQQAEEPHQHKFKEKVSRKFKQKRKYYRK